MDLEQVDLEKLIGLGAAPLLIPVLVAHLKSAVGAARHVAGESAWPLVADGLGIAWGVLAWQAGLTPDEVDKPLTAGMAGLVLGGLAGSVLRDQVVRVAGSRVAPADGFTTRQIHTSYPAAGYDTPITTPPPPGPPPPPPLEPPSSAIPPSRGDR